MEEESLLVSVIVNCYNGERHLKKCLSSILNQTYQNWEVIFWDNASTDDSAKIYNSYKDSRLKYFKSKINVTLGQARAWAVQKCNGEYIAFLDVDDEWFPEKTNIQIRQMIKENSYLSYSGLILKTDNGKTSVSTPKYKSGYIFNNLLNQFEVNMPSSMIKAEALNALNINFDPQVVASEEYDLFMQIAAKYNVSVIKEPLCLYRMSSNSLTNSSIKSRSHDKRITLGKLKQNYFDEVLKCRKSFRKAEAKIHYYEFQYSYSKKDYYNAKKELKKILLIDYRYFLILISLYIHYGLYKKILKLHDQRGIE